MVCAQETCQKAPLKPQKADSVWGMKKPAQTSAVAGRHSPRDRNTTDLPMITPHCTPTLPESWTSRHPKELRDQPRGGGC